jgi:hypothetical protein
MPFFLLLKQEAWTPTAIADTLVKKCLSANLQHFSCNHEWTITHTWTRNERLYRCDGKGTLRPCRASLENWEICERSNANRRLYVLHGKRHKAAVTSTFHLEWIPERHGLKTEFLKCQLRQTQFNELSSKRVFLWTKRVCTSEYQKGCVNTKMPAT